MKLKNYTEGKLSDTELEKMTVRLVKAKVDADHKKRWAESLSKNYGIDRPTGDTTKDEKGMIVPLKSRRLWWAVAAVGLLLSVGIPTYLALQSSLDNQIGQFIANDQFINREGGQKGAVAERPLLRQKAEIAYNQGDYETANRFYLQLLETAKKERGDYFFSGLCFLKLDEPIGAAGQFYLAREFSDEQPRFLPEIKFYLGLAFYRAGDPDAARQEWESIAPGGWRYQEAQEFLLRLSSR